MMSRRQPSAAMALAAIAAIAAAAAAVMLSPAAARAAGRSFEETATVVSVEVPVNVVRGGEPVRGLTADDFELYDGRQRQRISGFEVVDSAAPAAGRPAGPAVPAPAVSTSGRRHFLLLFDLAYSEPISVARARQAARDLVERYLQPGDLVSVATYRSTEGPKLFLGFTSDRRQIERAISTLGLPQLGERHPDPLGLTVSPSLETEGPIAGGGPHEQEVQDTLQSILASESRASRDVQASDVEAMGRALADLAKLLGSVPGRKYVVYLSEGFDSSVLVGSNDPATQKSIHDAVENGAASGVDNNLRFGRTKTSAVVEKMLDAFRRADCTIESFDLGGLRATTDQSPHNAHGEDSLFILANATGGELFHNTNDISKTMAELARHTSVTYVLTFEPAGLAANGEYHRLRVKLKNPRGATVSARSGYTAPRPYGERSVAERQLAAASLVLGTAGGRIPLAVLAAPFPVAGQKAYVPVVLEIGGPALLAGAEETAKADVYAYAMDEQGSVHDHFGESLGLDLAKVRGALGKGGLKLYGHFDLDPGRYVVRVLVRNGVTGEASVAAAPLDVPSFAGGEPVLLPPLFPDAAGSFIVLRESGGRDKLRDVPLPFRGAQGPFLPAARPLVRAGGEAPLFLVASGLGDGEMRVEGRVFTAAGGAASAGAVAFAGRPGLVQGMEELPAVFRPGDLPPGDYTLVVTLTATASRKAASSALAFTLLAASPAPGAGAP